MTSTSKTGTVVLVQSLELLQLALQPLHHLPDLRHRLDPHRRPANRACTDGAFLLCQETAATAHGAVNLLRTPLPRCCQTPIKMREGVAAITVRLGRLLVAPSLGARFPYGSRLCRSSRSNGLYPRGRACGGEAPPPPPSVVPAGTPLRRESARGCRCWFPVHRAWAGCGGVTGLVVEGLGPQVYESLG